MNEGFARSPADALGTFFVLNEASLRVLKKGRLMKTDRNAVTESSIAFMQDNSSEVYEFDSDMYREIKNRLAGSVGIVFIGRVGGESSNYPTDPLADGTPHVLALTQLEREMIACAKEHCDGVVAVINSSNVMEVEDLLTGPLECDAVLWIGGPGNTGFLSLADILAGEINPSGRTPDIWPCDLLADPAQANFCDIRYRNTEGIPFASNYNGTNRPAGLYFIEYEEGIYVGYRYYETACELGELVYGKLEADGQKTTEGAVNFPFGYGLSYTEFTQKITRVSYDPYSDQIDVRVAVTNLGPMDGKEVIQIYVQPPFTEFDAKEGVEKASKNLVAFDKLFLKSGETKEVTLSFLREELASYCMTRENPDGTRGCYMLEKGEYILHRGKNSHESWDTGRLNVKETIFYDSDHPRRSEREAQGEGRVRAAVNQFEDVTAYMKQADVTCLTRTDFAGTFPTPPMPKDLDEERLARVLSYDPFTDPFTGNEGIYAMPVQKADEREKSERSLTLADMRGREFEDPVWETFLDQVDYTSDTLHEMLLLASGHTAAFEEVGKPLSMDRDGPQGLHVYRGSDKETYGYCAKVVLAATFNRELSFDFGESIGNEALLIGLTGWYAPGLNIHRSAFCGRNFEYFSEDPLLSGRMGAACISGAAKRGVVCYMKHFAMNNYEGPATCLAVWATEQTIREIYLKSFEIAVKEASATLRYYEGESAELSEKTIRAAIGIMGAANRIGTEWCAADYSLLQKVLRGEWGFRGTVTTDMMLQTVPGIVDQIFRGGGDLRMFYYEAELLDSKSSPSFAGP